MEENEKSPADKRQRRTVDEQLAAIADEEKRLLQIRRAKRTHGFIVIGTALVAKAAGNWSVHNWLHGIWAAANERDRESVRIACGDIDVTKPPAKPKLDEVSPQQKDGAVPPPASTSDREA